MWSALNHRLSVGLLLVLCIIGVNCYEIEDIPFDKEGNTEQPNDAEPSQTDKEHPELKNLANELHKLRIFGNEVTSRLNQLDKVLQLHGTQIKGISSISNRLESGLKLNSESINKASSHFDKVESEVQSNSARLTNTSSSLERLSAQLERLSARLDEYIEAKANASRQAAKAAPRDCSELPAGAQSGVHLLRPGVGGAAPVPAYCDLEADGGNWTVLQRRTGTEPREDFYRNWAAYKEGFGELNAEFWWGLENMWAMVSPRDRKYELRVDMEDVAGEKLYATYQTFRISSEADGYRLTVDDYSGNAGDGLSRSSGQRFSTMDKDNTRRLKNCAQRRVGAWWYKYCGGTNLNGRYFSGRGRQTRGISWRTSRRVYHILKTVTMKIRPTPVV